jgi:type IV pilus assembly protein PilV
MSRQSNEKGFTLVELLVALTLMTVGILAMVEMEIVATHSNSIANKLSVATSLAQEVMDDIQSWDINAPPVTGAFTANSVNVQYSRLGTGVNANSLTFQDSGTYQARYSITLVPPDLSTVLISVTVTGGGRTVTLTSLKRVV